MHYTASISRYRAFICLIYWLLQACSQDNNHFLCSFILVHKWQNLQLKDDTEGQIFEKLLIAIAIYSRIVFNKRLLRDSSLQNIFTNIILLEMFKLEFESQAFI